MAGDLLTPGRIARSGIVLAILLFLAVNAFAGLSLRGPLVDATANRQYTLSDGTRTLLEGVTEPVTLRFYRSASLREANPFLASYGERVADLLATFAQTSNGMIRVETIDPVPFSPEEDRAVGFGVQAIPIGDASYYLGVAGTNSTDDVDTVPILSPERERFLEYDLTRLVNNLATPKKPVVALISALPLSGDPMRGAEAWELFTQLGQFYDVRQLGGEIDRIEPDVGVVVIVHPKDLAPRTQWAIDQFVLGGGRAIVFVDPHAEAEAARAQGGEGGPSTSDLPQLFAAWGIAFDPEKVATDAQAARQVTYPVNGRNTVLDYLPWLVLGKTAMAPDEPAVADLSALTLLSAGVLSAKEGATTTLTPLVRTSTDSMTIPAREVRTIPDPLGLLDRFQPSGQPLVVAARVTGPAKSAFAEPPDGVSAEGRLTESKQPIQVVVVADVDLLEDDAWLQRQPGTGTRVPFADNGGFVLNLVDQLAGSSALMSLRSRDIGFRPFTTLEAMRRDAERRYRSKEQELTRSLADVQAKLADLGGVGQTQEGQLLSAAQKAEIDSFRTQMVDLRAQLRAVQLDLRRDIEAVEGRIRFWTIASMPILVGIVALVVALIRRQRSRRRFEATA